MKNALAALLSIIAANAVAGEAWVNDTLQDVRWFDPPQLVKIGGLDFDRPTPELRAEAGWYAVAYDCDPSACVVDWNAPVKVRCKTAQEIESDALAAAEQAAASEAAMGLPDVFENGVAVVDEQGHHIELVPLADGEPVVGIQISNSPLDPAVRDQMKAEKLAEIKASKAAKDATSTAEVDKLVKKIDKAKDVKELGNAIVAYIQATKE